MARVKPQDGLKSVHNHQEARTMAPKLTRNGPGSYSTVHNGQSLSITRIPWGYGSSYAGMWMVRNDNDRNDFHDPVWTLREAKADIEARI